MGCADVVGCGGIAEVVGFMSVRGGAEKLVPVRRSQLSKG